jgi:hypothetical protein
MTAVARVGTTIAGIGLLLSACAEASAPGTGGGGTNRWFRLLPRTSGALRARQFCS